MELDGVDRSVMPGPGWTAVCAVSGGLDSMCLLHLLRRWCEEEGADLTAAHFDHRLRPSSARDAAFVRDQCAVWGIPFVCENGDVEAYASREGLSIEEAARDLRYAFLRRTADQRPFSRIYTAHHMDDDAETVLLALIRGTGIRGLSGIRPYHDGICRPLLGVSRSELEAYAAAHGIPFVEDETNADPEAAARNRIRLEVLPILRELNPRAAEHIHAAARRLAEIDASLEADARSRTARMEVRDGRVVLSGKALREATDAVRPRMLLCALDRLGVGRKDIGSVHLDAVLSLSWDDHGRERRLDLPHGVTARYQRGWLILETRPQPLTEVELVPGETVRWGSYTLCLTEGPVPTGEAREDRLILRERRWIPDPWDTRQRTFTEGGVVTVAPCPPGERLTLPGARGGRSVKRLCLDRRIPLQERDALPAIYVDGVLAAVWRIGVDAAFVPDGTGCRVIRIEEEGQGP